ncbi:hypothetical protein [Hymenobacter chitinivorans]|uniref:Lipoprotein n=1 Tax=Hymenobacter chitinivorans DSM 11115 TaxID=1121954 RepID=A0A2M9BLR1_9BACT|nr:hypothetical protein [Hymenobacter chitinivorans]PJJ58871.1 hypothetical protein CLV45_0282 [Hymenobacter chitinivorans DSM 11115]
MKATLPILALATVLATACADERPDVVTPEGCGSVIVQENVDGRGLVRYDAQNQVYTIRSSVAGTTNGQIVGFVCGALPEAFRQDSLPVSFTGTYTQYTKAVPPDPGLEYYYLSLSRLEAITGE